MCTEEEPEFMVRANIKGEDIKEEDAELGAKSVGGFGDTVDYHGWY